LKARIFFYKIIFAMK